MLTTQDLLDKCDIIIAQKSKTWLADRLGITRATLNSRLKDGKFKVSEAELIKTINLYGK